MSTALDALAADVAAEDTVIASAITLINGISKRLSDAVAAAQAGDLTQLTALDADVKSQATALAAAVTANTPAANQIKKK